MKPYPPIVAIALVLGASVAAGCLASTSEDEAPDDTPLSETEQNNTAELPDGRGESSGIKETNKTEEGRYGMKHDHDYWMGAEQVVILDRPVYLAATPIYPDGPNTQAKSVGYVKLGRLPSDPDRPALVYEGTARVTFLIDNPMMHPECEILNCDALAGPGAPHPAPPNVFLQLRTAADSDWREPIPVAYGEPIELEVAPREADMPHSVSSLWVFRLTSDRTDMLSVDFSVTVHRGREILDWPGHPEFYAQGNTRLVLQEHVTTQMSGIMEGVLYDSGGTWVHPEKLISWGTNKLYVILNITAVRNAYNADATGFFLEAHNATIIGPEITFGKRYFDETEPEDLKSWDFWIEVDENGMDGPYQPASRWGFRAMATFADVGPIGFCPGCFPYEIEYDITVFAIHEPEDAEA